MIIYFTLFASIAIVIVFGTNGFTLLPDAVVYLGLVLMPDLPVFTFFTI